jgi:hypothetical protein
MRGSLKPSANQRVQCEHRKGDLPNPPKLGTLAGSTSVISWRNVLVVTRAYRRKESTKTTVLDAVYPVAERITEQEGAVVILY